MANEKTLNTRMRQKSDIEFNWLKATNFTPLAGEIIVYAAETAEDNLPEGRTTPISYPRMKIGAGMTKINELPFTESPVAISATEEDGIITFRFN
jgi:hypothetical protein